MRFVSNRTAGAVVGVDGLDGSSPMAVLPVTEASIVGVVHELHPYCSYAAEDDLGRQQGYAAI